MTFVVVTGMGMGAGAGAEQSRVETDDGCVYAACRRSRHEIRASADQVSLDSARRILRPYVEEVRGMFLGGGVQKAKHVQVRVSWEAGDSGRHFAAASEDGDLILLSPDMVQLPEATIRGIVAHEFGHAMDFSYPARWVHVRGGLGLLDHMGKATEGQRVRTPSPEQMRAWKGRDADAVEAAADQIAEAVTGHRIGYTGACMLQTMDAGVPRPKGLR